MVSCFSFSSSVFHTLCFLPPAMCLSLSVVDHEIGLRLDALKHDYFLVFRWQSLSLERFCTMLHSTTFPYNVVGNDSAHFLNKVALFCDVLAHTRYSLEFSPLLIIVFSLAIVCCSCRAGIAKGNHFEFQSVTHFRMLTSKNGYVLVMIPQVTLGENSIEALPTVNVSTMVRSSENKKLYRQAQTT